MTSWSVLCGLGGVINTFNNRPIVKRRWIRREHVPHLLKAGDSHHSMILPREDGKPDIGHVPDQREIQHRQHGAVFHDHPRDPEIFPQGASLVPQRSYSALGSIEYPSSLLFPLLHLCMLLLVASKPGEKTRVCRREALDEVGNKPS